MATNKELTAKNRELKADLKRCAQEVTELGHELSKTAESRLEEAVHGQEMWEALSGFSSPAYKTYLGLAKRMGKRDTDVIDISIRLGLLKRVYELAASGRPIKEEEEKDDEED